MQVCRMLDHSVIEGSGDRDEVEHRQMLHQLAQTHPARMRAYRDAELCCQQQDRDVLVDPAHAGGIDLQDVNGAGL